MKQNSIKDLPLLNLTNFENVFNVYQDENSKYFYNLLQTVVLPTGLPDSYFTRYVTKLQDTWPYISYKTLGRIDLWWIIAQFNGVVNPTSTIDTGITLRIPTIDVVNTIIDSINFIILSIPSCIYVFIKYPKTTPFPPPIFFFKYDVFK